MIKDSSWILSFIEDLRAVAAQRELHELASDLEAVIERHQPELSRASAPTVVGSQGEFDAKVVPLTSRRKA